MTGGESLLEFPCDLPIKVFGRNQADFRATVLSIIRAHCDLTAEHAITEQLSREGRFVSLTVSVRAETRAQIDAVYVALTASDVVLMAL
jgi:putative lipoic acid-binding regulatory protein